MGLKRALRRFLLRRRLPVPSLLVRHKERPLYAALNRLRPGDIVIDLGANVGRTVTLFAGRGCVVHAYEPNPDAFAVLQAAVAGHRAVSLHQAAVGEAAGHARLYLHTGYRGGDHDHLESSSLLADKSNVDPERFYEVEVRDAAEVVAAVPGRIALLKIDVEGAEYAILRRLIAAGALHRIERVVVETHADRIASLRDAHREIEALIAARGLGAKIRFGWE
jgi:FkbM family methyltransferase